MTDDVADAEQCDSACAAGPVRETNEDFVFVDAALGLYLVGDGHGVYPPAEHFASMGMLVRLTLRRLLHERDATAEALVDAIVEMNDELVGVVERDARLAGAGASLSAVLWPPGDRMAHVAQVGDTQAFLVEGFRPPRLMLAPHTLAREQLRVGMIAALEESEFRTVVTRAVGYQRGVEVDVTSLEPPPGSALVLVTDGVHSDVDDRPVPLLVLQALARADRPARALVDYAHQHGGEDNAAAVVIRRH